MPVVMLQQLNMIDLTTNTSDRRLDALHAVGTRGVANNYIWSAIFRSGRVYIHLKVNKVDNLIELESAGDNCRPARV